MSNCPIPLHELLLILCRDECKVRQEIMDKAEAEAIERLSRTEGLSPEERAYWDGVRQGTRNMREAYEAPNDDGRMMRFTNERDRIYMELATPRCEDRPLRRTPFNFTLEQLVVAGVDLDQTDLRWFVEQLAEELHPSPDHKIAKSLAELDERGVTDRVLSLLWQRYPGDWLTDMELPEPGEKPETATDGAGQGGNAAAHELEQFPARHSQDFRSVHWFGTDYSFTALQAAIVRELWAAWEQGTPDLSDARLLTRANSAGDRLSDLFKSQPAWGSMIVSGSTKGTRRLRGPSTP